MDSNDYNHFVCIVAGDNPQQLIEKYKEAETKEPHIKYPFKDAGKLHQRYIALYESILSSKTDLSPFEREAIETELQTIKDDTDTEFFFSVTEGYDHDKETGDALEYVNPDAKYTYCNIGKNLSQPMHLINGTDSFSAFKKDIDWGKTHIGNTGPYELAWELVMEKRKPHTDTESVIYENMKGMTKYFQKFGTKENYIKSSCSFWGFAFLSEETGWIELEPEMEQFKWVEEFYDRFIEPLDGNTLLSVYECKRC